VLNCDGVGFDSDVVAGLEWATDNYLSNRKKAIAVLAFEGPFSKALNAAVNAAYQSGLGSIVAAGNDHTDACNYSPASAASVISVAAIDITDRRASFTNGGTCVSMFAPGVNITSNWLNGQTRSFSGTSISAAFAAGVAVDMLAEPGGPTSFDVLKARMFAEATPNVIDQTSDTCANTGPPALRCAPLSPNRLLFHPCLDD
jgi:serine protease